MQQSLLDILMRISPEEEAIQKGGVGVEQSLYASGSAFVVDSQKMLRRGMLMDMRPHTRFAHFPRHRHNYLEIIYMCQGQTTHIINDRRRLQLKAGELLLLNPHASHEILPCGYGDLAVNFIILPEFFDLPVLLMDEGNLLWHFLMSALREENGSIDHLYFQVSDILPIQNIVENLIHALTHPQGASRRVNQTSMGLLLLLLQGQTGRICSEEGPEGYEQGIFWEALRYIDHCYATASLEELSHICGQPAYALSRLIKKNSGNTFKQLLQERRLRQAARLLRHTALPIDRIAAMTGYSNTSFFHRIFKQCYGHTPREYRLSPEQGASNPALESGVEVPYPPGP